jgi:hypothetical protein
MPTRQACRETQLCATLSLSLSRTKERRLNQTTIATINLTLTPKVIKEGGNLS